MSNFDIAPLNGAAAIWCCCYLVGLLGSRLFLGHRIIKKPAAGTLTPAGIFQPSSTPLSARTTVQPEISTCRTTIHTSKLSCPCYDSSIMQQQPAAVADTRYMYTRWVSAFRSYRVDRLLAAWCL